MKQGKVIRHLTGTKSNPLRELEIDECDCCHLPPPIIALASLTHIRKASRLGSASTKKKTKKKLWQKNNAPPPRASTLPRDCSHNRSFVPKEQI